MEANNLQDLHALFNRDKSVEFTLGFDDSDFIGSDINADDFNSKLIENGERASSFGVTFIDECLSGIAPNDLIVVSAAPGVGKTQIATNIAINAARSGKRVYFLALEAYHMEIHHRLIYRAFAKRFFEARAKGQVAQVPICLTDFNNGVYSKLFPQMIAEATAEVNAIGTLKVHYPEQALTIDRFKQIFHKIKNNSDLIIVDHLHFFDFGGDQDTQAIKQIVHEMKQLSGHYEKPIILVSHIRKTDRKNATDVPMLDDLHGSSEIAKTATKVITFGRLDFGGVNYTCIATMKNRYDGARMYQAGLVEYDQQAQGYKDAYIVGEIGYFNGKFKAADPAKYPHWALSSVNADKPSWITAIGPIRSVPGANFDKPKPVAPKPRKFSPEEIGL